jgi:flagellar P-ring protein precursor FlgI
MNFKTGHVEKLKKAVIFCLLLFTINCSLFTAAYAERIKDIANFSGIRENELIGYGIVVGLSGTGDRDALHTLQPFANMLTRMGVSVNPADLRGKTKNIAAVVVTARFPTMVRPGSRIDVQVSSIGDARTLQGGTLLMTPLMGPDGNVYAVAQGPVSIGGFLAGGEGARIIRNHPTVGTIPNGAIVEREVPVQLNRKDRLYLLLTSPDITTAKRAADSINKRLNGMFARPEGPSVVSIAVPDLFRNRVVELMSEVELVEVEVDTPARVVINERTGTVVIGDNVRISPVAVAHGALTITIKTEYEVFQPLPFAPPPGEVVIVPRIEILAEEQEAPLMEVSGVTIGELVRALNALGVTPKDLVAILQAIKTAGALRAELVIK